LIGDLALHAQSIDQTSSAAIKEGPAKGGCEVGSGIKEFHEFIFDGEFAKEVRKAYLAYEILSEGDLQALAWMLICEFLKSLHTRANFKVLNKPYFKDLRIHPDIAVFRKEKPWVLVELKESRRLTQRGAQKEWNRLVLAKKHMRAKRGYLVYVARWGDKKILKGPKGRGAKFFFEVPVILQNVMTKLEVTEWEKEFRKHAKFTLRK
jgi:hypothetical protein